MSAEDVCENARSTPQNNNGRCSSASLIRPFRKSRPVARTEAAAGGRYPLPGLTPDSNQNLSKDRRNLAIVVQCRQPKYSRDLTRVLSETTFISRSGSELQGSVGSIPCAEPIMFCSPVRFSQGKVLQGRCGAIKVRQSSQRTPSCKQRQARLQHCFKERY